MQKHQALLKRSLLPRDLLTSQILEADLVLWSAGQAPVSRPGVAAVEERAGPALPFATNARGALQTDPTLRALHHSRVFALGDIAVRCGWDGRAAAAQGRDSMGALPGCCRAGAAHSQDQQEVVPTLRPSPPT